MLTLIACSTVVNTIYFLAGMQDSRISATATRRSSKDGYWINLARIAFLVSIQIIYYLGVGL